MLPVFHCCTALLPLPLTTQLNHHPPHLPPPPLPPCRDDYKEGQRQKLAGLIHSEASSQNSRRFSPKMTVLDVQVGVCWVCM